MLKNARWVENALPKMGCADELALMDAASMNKARAFHQSMPGYAPTPLARLDNLAHAIGVRSILVKDESHRFGLNAFKVLGGSFAMARYIAGLLGVDVSELPYDRLTSSEVREKIGEVTFFTATDGNHGRGVAWAANRLGQKAVVYMPKGSSITRLQAIRAEGATASIIEGNYDDAVRLAASEAAKVQNGVVVQDTAWDGYEEIPAYIMQGYGTMAMEADEQCKEQGLCPTHVIVQAGVGSLAGAVQGFFTNTYGANCPVVTVVEADVADCLYRSAVAGEYRIVDGDMQTIMAGLACGEPNTISWKILHDHTNLFVSAPDWMAAKGMRTLSAPLRGDDRVISGESGAIGAGLLASVMTRPEYAELRDRMRLTADSVVLLFSTEGDTDPDKYRDIVWDGEYASK